MEYIYEMTVPQIVLVGCIIYNIIVFLLYGTDKYLSKIKRWRISEKTLLLLAFMGGSLGAIFGMQLWRHKTKHLKFMIIVPICLILQLAMVYIYYFGIPNVG